MYYHEMDELQRDSINVQFKHQLRHFKTCTQPFIGRINRQPTRNFYEHFGLEFIDSETDFDDY